MTAPDWLAMPPGAFDTAAPDVPLTLFAAPDAVGTLDLFTTEEED